MVGKLGFDGWSSDLGLTVPTHDADQDPLCLRLSTLAIHRHPQNRRHYYIVERPQKEKSWLLGLDFPCFCYINLDFVVVECVQLVAK